MTAATLPGLCRADLPVQHPLTRDDVHALNWALNRDDVPVTVRSDGGRIILHPALALTARQMAHTLRLVCARTDAPVRWVGAL